VFPASCTALVLTWGTFAFFLGFARASDKNSRNFFFILYFVYGTTVCRSRNNGISWKKS